MPMNTISHARAQQIYDTIGRRYDWAAPFEAEVKRRALRLARIRPGESVLEIGCGTGRLFARLSALVRADAADGRAVGVDLSARMLAVTRARLLVLGNPPVDLLLADAVALPFAESVFDLVISTYVFDLLPEADIDAVLRDCRRLLHPGGRLVVAGMSPGEGLYGRIFTTVYGVLYRAAPSLLGGCRPLRLEPRLAAAGFSGIRRFHLTRGHPSEILAARKPL